MVDNYFFSVDRAEQLPADQLKKVVAIDGHKPHVSEALVPKPGNAVLGNAAPRCLSDAQMNNQPHVRTSQLQSNQKRCRQYGLLGYNAHQKNTNQPLAHGSVFQHN